MPRRLARLFAAVCAFTVLLSLGASVFTAPPAEARIALNCGVGGDSRTTTDALPRPGVVTRETLWGGTVWHQARTIMNDGSLSSILLDGWSWTDPIVAVWENGTNCWGSEISRNAWAVAPNGRVFTGNGFSGPIAGHFGDASHLPLNQPIVGMTPTATGLGYWLVASDGGIFTFGDAQFFGSTGNIRLNQPIVGMSVTPTGRGYWLVASDGGIFSFGDAQFFGSTGNIRLNQPITGMTATPSGRGYWMVASDGGIFTFGDANFRGSVANLRRNDIAGMIPWGNGYMIIANDGTLFPFR